MLTKLEANNKRWLFDPDLEEKCTETEIKLKQLGIHNYTINSDGTIDIDGDIDIDGSGNTPTLPLKFNKVTGNFTCTYNGLTSLEGAPKYVDGDFTFDENLLTSLEGAPKYVGGDFNCMDNKLTSLEGTPKYVGGDFNCMLNKKHFTVGEIKSACDVKGEIIC